MKKSDLQLAKETNNKLYKDFSDREIIEMQTKNLQSIKENTGSIKAHLIFYTVILIISLLVYSGLGSFLLDLIKSN